MELLPLLPFDILLPVASVVLALLGILVIFILGRRAVTWWHGRAEDVWVLRAQTLLADWLAERITLDQLRAFLLAGGRHRYRGFVDAVERLKQSGAGNIIDLLQEKEIHEVLGRAVRERRGRWDRATAAWALGRLCAKDGMDDLAHGLNDPKVEVRDAAAQALAELDSPAAAQLLVQQLLVSSTLNIKRLSGLLESMTCDLSGSLSAALASRDATANYWTLRLIGLKKITGLLAAVRGYLTSSNSEVRAAAAEAIGRLGAPEADRWLEPLLDDPEWFVQVQAIKSLAALKAQWAIPGLAQKLSSSNWWVRHSASEALINLGPQTIPEVEEVLLRRKDRFARNSAITILERLGWLEETIASARQGMPRARRCLEEFAEAGGIGFIENTLLTIPPESVAFIFPYLERYGDKITGGRIKNALSRFPQELQHRALELTGRLAAL